MNRAFLFVLLLAIGGCGTAATPAETPSDTADASEDTDAVPTDTPATDTEPVEDTPTSDAPTIDTEPPEDAGPSEDVLPPEDTEPPEDGGPTDVEPDAPECVDGEVSTVEVSCEDGPAIVSCECVAGAWECTPDPCEEPTPCRQDAECSTAEYCDDCATSSCPDCEDCVAGCMPHGCPTEDSVTCRILRPDCGDSGVAVAVDGCWECVDSNTCERAVEPSDCERSGGTCFDSGECPEDWDRIRSSCGTRAACCVEPEPVAGECDDGTELVCFMAEPRCEDSEIIAIQDGCWVCVNPATCLAWGEPGCETARDCDRGEVCDDCGTSSCPFCADCVAACVERLAP